MKNGKKIAKSQARRGNVSRATKARMIRTEEKRTRREGKVSLDAVTPFWREVSPGDVVRIQDALGKDRKVLIISEESGWYEGWLDSDPHKVITICDDDIYEVL